MSVTSTINRHNQQQFSMRAGNGAQAGSNNTKSADALVKGLTSSASPLSDEDHKAAKSLIEDYKEAVDLNSKLSKSIKDNKDALREQKVEQIQQRIKQLKEMLRFASPQQAKRMLKELKQVSKEFSAAAKDLGKAGTDAGTGAPNPAVQANTKIVTSVIDSTFATSQQNSLPLNTSTTSEILATASVEAHAATAASAYKSSGEPTTAAEQKESLKTAIYAYADQQATADKAHFDSRIDGMREEHEELRKISEELKNLAGWLETLADKDDRDTKKTIKDTWDAIKKGIDHLNDSDLHESLEVSSATQSESSQVSASSTTINVPSAVTGSSIIA
ncbi:MAG: hypothetical protein ABJL55_15640 [Roseibium sp.]